MKIMKNRKLDSKRRYLWAFIIGTFLFFLGFYITYLVSQTELRNIGLVQNQLSYGLFEQKLINSFFLQNICEESTFSDLNRYRAIQGGAIDSLEKKYGKDNSIVLERKKFYTLIQIAHLEFLEERIEKCEYSMNVLMFFYSNQPSDAEESSRVGSLLDIVGNRGHNLQIYSFDYFLDSELIELLKEKYNVVDYPLIANLKGERVISPKNINEIESLLN
jgi:hypothetical protein